MKKLIDKLKSDFLENGGAREQMFKARREFKEYKEFKERQEIKEIKELKGQYEDTSTW